MEDDRKYFLQMEDDLNYFSIEEDLYLFVNRR